MPILKQVELQDHQMINNISKFARLVARPGVIRMVKALNNNPMTYSEIYRVVFPYSISKSNCDYHLRKCKKDGILQIDRDGRYFLSFRGVKLLELINSLDKIANLDNSTPNNAMVKLDITIEQSKTWLEPFLKSELSKFLKQYEALRK